MSDGDAVLASMIARLRAVQDLPKLTAAEAAPLVQTAARATAAAGTDPSGKAWAPRKRDGGRAMANAASHVTVKARGDVVQVTLTGPDVFHQFSKSHPRKVIPEGGGTGGLPAGIAAAMHEGAARAFAKMMGGAP